MQRRTTLHTALAVIAATTLAWAAPVSKDVGAEATSLDEFMTFR